MCIKLGFIEDIKESIEDIKESRRYNAMMRKLPHTFNPDHLERLREHLVRRNCLTIRSADEIAAMKGPRPLTSKDIMVEVPLPDHLKTREMQWQHMLQKYQRSLERADSLAYERVYTRELRDGTCVYERPPPEEIRTHKARLQVMIDAIKKKIDAESTAALQSDAGSSWSE